MTTDPIQARKLTIADLDIPDIELGPMEVVEGAILVLRTVAMTGEGRTIGLTMAMSRGLDFIAKRGMAELLHDEVLEEEDHGEPIE